MAKTGKKRGMTPNMDLGRILGRSSQRPAWGPLRGPSQLPAKIGAVVLFGLVIGLGLVPTAALATRNFNSKILGFRSVSSAAIDASGNMWFTDGGEEIPGHQDEAGLYEYNSYPSQTRLNIPRTGEAFGGILDLQVAVDHSNGDIFVTQDNGRSVGIFDEDGNFIDKWESINGARAGYSPIHIAIDNSNSASRGRIYLSLTSPENDVEAFDSGERPVQFPATASYINENKLTGTPSGHFGKVGAVAVDGSGDVYVDDSENEVVDEFNSAGIFLRSFDATGPIALDPTNGAVLIGGREYDSHGNLLGTLPTELPLVVNSSGYLYASNGPGGEFVEIFAPAPALPEVSYGSVSEPTTTSGTLHATINPNGGGDITACQFEYGTGESYGLGTLPCSPATEPYSGSTPVSAGISSLTTEATYHYRVVATDANGTTYGEDQTYTPHDVIGLSSEAASNLSENGATLTGSLVGDGTDTHYYFEWGPTSSYGHTAPAPPGDDLAAPSGPAVTPLESEISGLAPYTTYHYRVVASNPGGISLGEDRTFTTLPGTPTVNGVAASEVHSDHALLHAQINPNGAETMVRFEYVSESEFQEHGFSAATTVPAVAIAVGMGKQPQAASTLLSGLSPGTRYHFRAIAINTAGTTTSEGDFTTFAFTARLEDPCPNAHVRQQTGSSLLLDCRAYELVSASNSGGYDVESSLIAGQTPFGGYPDAEVPSRVLYGIHDGALASGEPTNRGVDPYVATRGSGGWSTEYVGIPAHNPNASGPFSSTLLEAGAGLETFAFGGPEICSPCFADGSTGEPIHLPNGELVQGMAGSIPQPTAKPEGFIGKDLSANGEHFIFGSKSQFEPEGNNNGADLTIYDRDLQTEETKVVSKTPGGQTMTGPGIGELDISKDGSQGSDRPADRRS